MNKTKNKFEELVSTIKTYKRLNDVEISKPYHLNWRVYISLLVLSSLILIVATYLKCLATNAADIIKSLSIGCFSSTIIALLIEKANIEEKNQKAKALYDNIYFDPQFCIMSFLKCWGDICSIVYKDKDYKKESHTWLEWYDIFKTRYISCGEERKKEISRFAIEHLEWEVEKANNSLHKITNQRYLLEVNNLYNTSIHGKLANLEFEFKALKMELERCEQIDDETFKMFDAIVADFKMYISNWKDISYLNYYCHSPYELGLNREEYLNALEKSKPII